MCSLKSSWLLIVTASCFLIWFTLLCMVFLLKFDFLLTSQLNSRWLFSGLAHIILLENHLSRAFTSYFVFLITILPWCVIFPKELQRVFLQIADKKTGEWYIKWRVIMSDSERYNEWQQMTMSGTTGDNDLQRMRATGFYSIFFKKIKA